MSLIEIVVSVSKVVPTQPNEVESLVADRFCSLMEDDMDIHSLGELAILIEKGYRIEMDMDIENTGQVC